MPAEKLLNCQLHPRLALTIVHRHGQLVNREQRRSIDGKVDEARRGHRSGERRLVQPVFGKYRSSGAAPPKEREREREDELNDSFYEAINSFNSKRNRVEKNNYGSSSEMRNLFVQGVAGTFDV